MKINLKGFTLIELLVVIAIIAILAAILFPVFAQAREKARQANCLSNTKQFGTALQLYVDDYDETYPIIGDQAQRIVGVNTMADNNGAYKGYPGNQYITVSSFWWADYATHYYTWADAIFPYVKNVKMYVCPSGDRHAIGYSMNANLVGSTGCFGINAISNNDYTTHSMSEVPNPSETVFVCDAPIATWNHSSCMGVGVYHMTNFTTAASPTAWQGAIRHNGGANFTLMDGHAKYFKDNQGPLAAKNYSNYVDDNVKYWDFRVE
ncbi:MAG: DUF1559 domain-containing protein [Abditibacteriota bacterium]|nr:DUF1559 domain-containing protein [Abditibacteriota bacterium]